MRRENSGHPSQPLPSEAVDSQRGTTHGHRNALAFWMEIKELTRIRNSSRHSRKSDVSNEKADPRYDLANKDTSKAVSSQLRSINLGPIGATEFSSNFDHLTQASSDFFRFAKGKELSPNFPSSQAVNLSLNKMGEVSFCSPPQSSKGQGRVRDRLYKPPKI